MNSSQRNGTFVLLVILILIAIVPPIFSHYYRHPQENDQAFRAEVENFLAKLQKDEGSNHDKRGKYDFKKENKRAVELFTFNPNTISETDWCKLGLSEKQAKTIINYRNKGGKFRIKADLKKIYSIHEDQFSLLLPYIDLPEVYEEKKSQTTAYESNTNKTSYHPKTAHEIDINQADTAVYASLPGIGTVISARIVKYREKLGGFIKKDQVAEVFGLKAEVYEQLENYLICKSGAIKKLSLNFSTMSELAKHPYIGYQKAKAIVEYRSKNGAYSSLEQLVKANLLNSEELARISPYLNLKN